MPWLQVVKNRIWRGGCHKRDTRHDPHLIVPTLVLQLQRRRRMMNVLRVAYNVDARTLWVFPHHIWRIKWRWVPHLPISGDGRHERWKEWHTLLHRCSNWRWFIRFGWRGSRTTQKTILTRAGLPLWCLFAAAILCHIFKGTNVMKTISYYHSMQIH